MELRKLIAESGGTKTDWFGTDAQNKKIQFSSESFHPANIDQNFIKRQRLFWENYQLQSCEFHFFGAGCLYEDKKQLMFDSLTQLGFEHIYIFSDLHAAFFALNKTTSPIAICGTGSVVFQFESESLTTLQGGLGWEHGDEGSGFYFGKLIVENLSQLKQNHSKIFNQINQWKNEEELNQIKHQSESKYIFAQIPALLTEFTDHPFIHAIHVQNCQLMIDKYMQNIHEVHFVGSYAYYHQAIFKMVCKKNQLKINSFLARPIEKLKSVYL